MWMVLTQAGGESEIWVNMDHVTQLFAENQFRSGEGVYKTGSRLIFNDQAGISVTENPKIILEKLQSQK